MRAIRLLATLFLVATTSAGVAAELTRSDLDALLGTPIGGIVEVPGFQVDLKETRTVRLKRIDVYANDARIVHVDNGVEHEVPRSTMLSFISAPNSEVSPYLGFVVAADGSRIEGGNIGDGGMLIAIEGSMQSGRMQLSARDASSPEADGQSFAGSCFNDLSGTSMRLPSRDQVNATFDAASPTDKVILAASRSARVAIDSDNEFMSERFSNNTTTATNWLTSLFTQLNAIYERDLDVTLLVGDVFWRTGSDPFSVDGSDPFAQLTEFGSYWASNNAGINRAFAAQMSGKLACTGCFSGIAWVLDNRNYCNQKASNGGHYSVNQTQTNTTSATANDAKFIGHEIGHNFGANHTHCSDATTGDGNPDVSTNTMDTCYAGEAGSGCYGGATSCPAAQTINGVTNVRGTIMSYCHLLGGCSNSAVFATAHVNYLTPFITLNVNQGCFTTGGAPGTFTITDASITEGNSGTQTLNFVVTRSGGTGSGSVTAATSDGTATASGSAPISDYVTKTQVLTFAAAGTQNFAVTINGDTRDEDNETFTVTLSAPSAGFSLGSPSSATGTLTDNDNAPTVSINSPAAATEGTTITFTVSLSAASGKAISVAHTTASGAGASGATEGSDFSDATGTLNFAADETSKTFNVGTSNDTLDEADTETFTATLSAPSNATLGTSSGTGSINDNDPLPSVAIADTSITEGGNLQFTVTLTPVSGRTVTVPFSTADGTATVANNDYLQTSSSIQIAAGNTTGQIIINTVSDAVDEPDETMTVNLGSPTNASVSDGSATGTILDDDITAAAVSIADATLTEGNAGSANMVFTLTIPSTVAQATSVTYGTSPLDATATLDYIAVTGTATIAAGSTSTTIGVPIVGDLIDEWDEQFTVNLAATASSTLADGQAVGTIIDDDAGGDPVYRNGFE